MNEPIVLKVNPSSRDWLIVKEWAERELDILRRTNDSVHLDAVPTAILRGRISQLLALRALGDPTPEPIADDYARE